MVISGAPEETEFHPVHICELALDFIEVAKSLTDPTTNQPIQLRIGTIISKSFKVIYPITNYNIYLHMKVSHSVCHLVNSIFLKNRTKIV